MPRPSFVLARGYLRFRNAGVGKVSYDLANQLPRLPMVWLGDVNSLTVLVASQGPRLGLLDLICDSSIVF